MRRGFFIVELLSYAIVPWKILASAATFTSFLSGYALFMASVVAIMLAECELTVAFKMYEDELLMYHSRLPIDQRQYFHRTALQSVQIEPSLPLLRRLQPASSDCIRCGHRAPFPGIRAVVGRYGSQCWWSTIVRPRMVAVLCRIVCPLLRHLSHLAYQEPAHDPRRGLGLGAEGQDADAGWLASMVARGSVRRKGWSGCGEQEGGSRCVQWGILALPMMGPLYVSYHI